ncbi:hypothetical protein TSUD_214330 [Trifolium subterraneum]|uniref:Uncharacterized protein n=1 Tax=Trifolium subterraneum TaxID=3900 RepID=A0A2Z6MWE5_TRISU|nr:hypothetical protein TSUD_214330 [Trifolium subterraneum]
MAWTNCWVGVNVRIADCVDSILSEMHVPRVVVLIDTTGQWKMELLDWLPSNIKVLYLSTIVPPNINMGAQKNLCPGEVAVKSGCETPLVITENRRKARKARE